jgi:asparagine synthase (glutamine-hydrolysing)
LPRVLFRWKQLRQDAAFGQRVRFSRAYTLCGLTGFWSTTPPPEIEAKALLERMTNALRHRGPDDAGSWYDAEVGAGLGHRRLSIVDLSAEGHQPMSSESGRYVIAFNGEVYNFAALRRELEVSGANPHFRGGSDTEVMLAAIERWGLVAATRRFVGMFAFTLWDRQQRELHLVRDRLGIKPLYYSVGGDRLLFGSELDALRQVPDFSSQLDIGALTSFFRFGYVPCPASIYAHARKLAPGTIATFASPNAPPNLVPYWSAEEAVARGQRQPFVGDLREATDALESLLSDAVRLRMIADVPLGAFLSGGIDSSLVVALMQRQAQGSVRTFSIGNEATGYDESESALAVARHLGTTHTPLRVTERQAVAVAPLLGKMYDEPFADSSQIPTYLVSQLARSQVTVALSGDGGDELFGGYNRHIWAPRVLAALRVLPKSSRRLAAKALTQASPEAWDRFYAANARVLPALRLPGDKAHKLASVLGADGPEELYTLLCSQWRNAEQVIHPALRDEQVRRPSALRLSGRSSFAAQTMFLDLVTYLPDDILTKVDRASMNVGLEARVPLLDHRVVEFAWTLPDKLKIRGNTGKLLLRSLLDRYFPRAQFQGPKMGFGVPVAAWLRGPLREWANDLLSPASLRRGGLLNEPPVTAALAEHLEGTRDRSRELWTVLMFVSWREARTPA